MKNDPFQTNNGRVFQADSLKVLDHTGKNWVKYSPRNYRDAAKLTQLLRSGITGSSNVYVFLSSNEQGAVPITSLKITGEFGYKGPSYSVNNDTPLVTSCRNSLAKAIADSFGPIVLDINGQKYYDICDVIGTPTSRNNQLQPKSTMEFIDRYGRSIVWISSRRNEEDIQIEANSQYIISRSIEGNNFVSEVRAKFKDGIDTAQSFYRKFTRNQDGRRATLRALFGIGYSGGGNFSQYNVNAVVTSDVRVMRSTTGSYKLSGSGLLYNNDRIEVSNPPVMTVEYSPGKSDFGIPNAKITVQSHNGKGGREI